MTIGSHEWRLCGLPSIFNLCSAQNLKRAKEANLGVSMLANPARYGSCYHQRVQKEIGGFIIGSQCISRRRHRESGRMAGMMDREFFHGVVTDNPVQLVWMVTKLLIKGDVFTKINNSLVESKDVDKRTTIYSACRKEI